MGFENDKRFQLAVLVTAINMMKTVTTPVLNKVFSRKKPQLTDVFEWEIKSGSLGLLDNIAVEAPATVADKTDRKIVTCKGPRYAEKRFIPASFFNQLKGFGTNQAGQLLSEKISDEQFDMKGKIDRTREFQAIKAIQGKVVDKKGNTIVDYNFAGDQKVTLAGDAVWDSELSDPILNLRSWKKTIARALGYTPSYAAFCGSGAMDCLIANKSILDKLKYTKGGMLADQGRIASLAGVTIEENFGYYKDDDGSVHEMIPENAFILVGLAPEATGELYAPVVDLEAPTGVGKNKKAQVFFSKSWKKDDPSGRWIKVESRPLPVLFNPGCIVVATVK